MTNNLPNVNEQELENALLDAESVPLDISGDTNIPTFIDKDGKVKTHALGKYLVEKHHVKTITGVKRETYIYQNGIYAIGDDILKKDIRILGGSECSNFHVREVIELIKDLTSIDREAFSVNVNLLNFNNGVFDLRTRDLLPHDPSNLFFTKIPIDYKPDAQCPIIKQYLSEVLDDDHIKVIQEWFGYSLYREYFIKKAIIFVGEGDTGKSTLISLFFAFFGEKNVSGIALQRMTTDKFAAANLYNRHINLYDDLSSKDVQDNGVFKIATGGSVISAEKKFMDGFVFKNYAKLTFACNTIPDVKNATDDAYYLRWIVIPFTRIIEEEKKDKQLIHKMTTPEELSGLLNFALEGLYRLLKNHRFSYEKETHEIKVEMMRSASSIARFAGDCLEESTGEWVSKEDMYYAYGEFTTQNKIPATTIKTFGSRLPMCAPYVAEFKPKDPKTGKQITAWRNVRLKNRVLETKSEEIDELSLYFPDHE